MGEVSKLTAAWFRPCGGLLGPMRPNWSVFWCPCLSNLSHVDLFTVRSCFFVSSSFFGNATVMYFYPDQNDPKIYPSECVHSKCPPPFCNLTGLPNKFKTICWCDEYFFRQYINTTAKYKLHISDMDQVCGVLLLNFGLLDSRLPSCISE